MRWMSSTSRVMMALCVRLSTAQLTTISGQGDAKLAASVTGGRQGELLMRRSMGKVNWQRLPNCFAVAADEEENSSEMSRIPRITLVRGKGQRGGQTMERTAERHLAAPQ